MIENSITLTLDQPPDRVFDFLTDLPNEPTWNPDCSSVEKLSAEPTQEGSTFRGRFRGMGQVMVELTAYRPHHRFATRERSRIATGDFDFALTPHGKGTQVDLQMTLRPNGPMRLLQPIMRRKISQFLADLPHHIQAGLDSADTHAGHAPARDPS
ncbi:SRPBCC family protein [Aeromicrobium sp.]|uniref:SRPBCC family protein n=1 Tax=Aeromicrobium sp. TaxID=1871063 RepID=UPI002FCB86AE